MALNSRDALVVEALSRTDVVSTLAGLQRFFPEPAWLGRTNRYSSNTVKRIKTELAAGGLRNQRNLAQYISASGLLHCSDGWSYLGKALLSLVRGDPHRCRHAAYYAELRAAMAILATQGVGVFDRNHFVIRAPNQVSRLSSSAGTHAIAWDALETWGSQTTSGSAFASIIKPYGRSLSDWLEPIRPAGIIWPQARKWLLQWGLDLKLPAKDRSARNESSYRVDGIPEAWYLNAPQTLTFARDVWTALEPASNSVFDSIDRHILRMTLESVFRSRTNRDASDDPARFADLVSMTVQHQDLGLKLAEDWTKFLTREISSQDLTIFALSGQKPNSIQGSSCESMISRAVLLLRIASGSTVELMRDAGITNESVQFWWQSLGQNRGIWDGQWEEGQLTDLWADVQTFIGDLEAFRQITPDEEQSFYRIADKLGGVLVGLSTCERVAIWSLTP
jgi:hypothetical protein